MEIKVIKNVDINELVLSVRTWNCLRRAQINTVQDIVDNYNNLTRIRNLGQRCYNEIVEKIKPYVRERSEELKPCPFCGGEVELLDYTDRVYGFWDYKIKCKKCRVYMDSPSTAVVKVGNQGIEQTRNEVTKRQAKRELIIIWNTREE